MTCNPILFCILLLGAATATLPAQDPADTDSSSDAASPSLSLSWSSTGEISLSGQHALHQLVLTARRDGLMDRDASALASYSVTPTGIVRVEPGGLIRVLADGEATITARLANASIQRRVRVGRAGESLAISFPNEVVPIFTRHGCNGGGCHGKAEGQNGFKLSLLGFEPEDDHGYLVQEARGRRIFRAAPEHSLLLLKGSGDLPHQGGSRLARNSDDYKTLVRWIRQGLRYGPANDPTVTRIAVEPRERLTEAGATQQLRVVAYFSDGSTKDVTRIAQYEANDEEMATTTQEGLVTMHDRPGSTSVMIRFQEHVDVFRATIPLGAPVDDLPEPANLVDERIFAKLRTLGLPPSPLSDDATFLRRVTIDIAGRLPTLEETDAFLSETNPAKRNHKIDTLLASTDYADYFAGKWAAILRNKRTSPHHARGSFAFHSWIRDSLHQNIPYHDFVRQFVSASGEVGTNPPVIWYRTVKDSKEQLQDVAQIFLGVRLQCAQCHHHPYEKWSQDDYYGFEAFFSKIGRKPGAQPGEEIIFNRVGAASAQNPRSGRSLKPKPLGEKELELASHNDPRDSLADWMTNQKNPFFAKMLVNRYWKHFFGRGLVDPEDDMRVTNPPTHPALLDGLARSFVESGYDLKQLIRTICNSRVYQLSAVPNEHNLEDRQNYSRFYPRRLPAEILLDGINAVTNSKETFKGQPQGVRAVQLPDDQFTKESYFLSVFGRPDMNSACECERADDVNLAQALHLVNSNNIRNKLAGKDGRAALLLANTEASDEVRISELYRRALSRDAGPDELKIGSEYLRRKRTAPVPEPPTGEEETNSNSPEQRTREAYEDLIWALLNTKEFLFNH
ncbi:MAG: S-layer protein [Verrucomicrobiaceae bacterium]|nr:S-layer protein [Verrucomicrobiaceae bacterium]